MTSDKYANVFELWWPRILFPVAVVLLVDDVLDQDWLGAAILTMLVVYAGIRLLRQRRTRSTSM